MTLFQIIGLYVGLNLLLHIFLMVRVGGQRMKSKVSLGDGDDTSLLGRIRAHGNFTENAPFVLIALITMAQLGATAIPLHIVGAGFTISRLFHSHGITREDNNGIGRTIGATVTSIVIVYAAIYILYRVFTG